MKNLKFYSSLFAITIMASCKKNDTIKQPTIDEMKIIVSQSSDLNQVFKLEDEINIIRETAFYTKIKNKRMGVKIMSTSIEKIDSLKSQSDLKIFLDSRCDNKGDEIISKIKAQLELIKQFGYKNPEFNRFSEDQKKELLYSSLIEYQRSLSLKRNLLISINSDAKVKLLGNCMGDFNINYNHCQSNYGWATVGIWAVVAFSGGSQLGAGLIAQIVAIGIKYDCEDQAAELLQNCQD